MPFAIRVGTVIIGPLLPQPIDVLAVIPFGDSVKIVGKGLKTGLVRDLVLSQPQLAQLKVLASERVIRRRPEPFPPEDRSPAARAGLRVRPLLLALDRPR